MSVNQMRQLPFRSLAERQIEVGLTDGEVAYMLGISEEKLAEWSTPGPHNLTKAEMDSIMNLSIKLGSLLSILKADVIRGWLFRANPKPGFDGRTPAEMIATGDAGQIDQFIGMVEHSLPN